MLSQAMIFDAVRSPSPVRRPPLASILERDDGTSTSATTARMTGQNGHDKQASTSDTIAVLSVDAGGAYPPG